VASGAALAHEGAWSAPHLTLPFLLAPGTAHPARRRWTGWLVVLAIGLVTGAAAAGVTSARAGLLVAALVVLGLFVPRTRVLSAFAGVGFVVAGCVNVLLGQAHHHYLPGSNWAGSFVHEGNLIWFGLVLLLADAVMMGFSAAGRPRRPAPRATGEPSPPT
jgi:hypothetical protein